MILLWFLFFMLFFFCFKQKTAYEMRISDWSSDVCSSDLILFKGSDRSASEQFWIIKHGIKMTAMPAWGKTHDDRLIWDMVAFIRQLPSLSPAQYQAMTQNVPMDHDAMMKGMTEAKAASQRSEEHTSELQSLMRISYAVFCLQKKTSTHPNKTAT